MRDSLQVTIAAFWLMFWSVRVISSYSSLIRTEDGRLFLALYGLAILMGAAFLAYILLKRYGPKTMAKINKNGRCPECYAPLKKNEGFCPKCGLDMRNVPKEIRCKTCGTTITDDDKMFCPKCGREIKR